jgi:hypothetical protein
MTMYESALSELSSRLIGTDSTLTASCLTFSVQHFRS